MPRTDRKPVPMFSLNQAAARGVDRMRQPNWTNELDHVKIDLFPDGTHGPWVHLYSPMNKWINGKDPVSMLWIKPNIDPDAEGFYAYTGPLPDSDEYQKASAEFIEFSDKITAPQVGKTSEP